MSREYKGERITIYPQYLDSTKSRRLGRKLSKSDAVPKPSVDEIVAAARDLGLDPIVEENKQYPRDPWSYDKRVVVLKKESKLSVLRRIAKRIKEHRGLC